MKVNEVQHYCSFVILFLFFYTFGEKKIILNGRGIVYGNFFDSDLASLKKKLRKWIVLNRLFNTPELTFRRKKKFSECPVNGSISIIWVYLYHCPYCREIFSVTENMVNPALRRDSWDVSPEISFVQLAVTWAQYLALDNKSQVIYNIDTTE